MYVCVVAVRSFLSGIQWKNRHDHEKIGFDLLTSLHFVNYKKSLTIQGRGRKKGVFSSLMVVSSKEIGAIKG